MTIIEFLEARLAEDEAVARGAVNDRSRGNWTFDDGEEVAKRESDRRGVNVCVHASVSGARFVLDSSGNPNYFNPEFVHVATFNPARVLREIAAKRAIVKDARLYADAQYPDFEGGFSTAAESAVDSLAAVYSDHPDFDPEWSRP